MATDIELPPYRITLSEYAAFNLHFLGRHYRKLRSWFIFLPAPLFVSIMVFTQTFDLPVWIRAGSTLMTFAVTFLIAFILMQGWALAACLMRFNKQSLAQNELKISVTDDFFTSAFPHQEGRYRWAGLHDIVRKGKISLIYVDAHMAVIIPDRIFPDMAAAEIFFIDIRDRWTRAKAGAAS